MKPKHYYLLLIVFAIIVFGFIREIIFIYLNEEISRGTANLILYKWILSLIFSALFFSFTFLSLRLLFNDSHIKLTGVCYTCVLVVSAAFYFIGSKNISVLFMHIAQSPIILMVLIPSIHLLKSEKK